MSPLLPVQTCPELLCDLGLGLDLSFLCFSARIFLRDHFNYTRLTMPPDERVPPERFPVSEGDLAAYPPHLLGELQFGTGADDLRAAGLVLRYLERRGLAFSKVHSRWPIHLVLLAGVLHIARHCPLSLRSSFPDTWWRSLRLPRDFAVPPGPGFS